MLWCADPYPLSKPGDGRKFNPHNNAVDFPAVACGKCGFCVANRKQCWTAKLVGESLVSQAATFVTLTYRTDPEGKFRYSDVQEFLHRLRKWALRKHNATVRFFCQGEVGKLGRVHWHLMLFFSEKLRVPVPEQGTLSQFWDYGWTNVQNLRPGQMVEKSRYVAKYVSKRAGDGCRPRCSLKPALGHVWLMRHARDTAAAALVPNGKYAMPGMIWTRGHRAGQTQWINIRGSQIRHYIREWRSEWLRRWDTAPPGSPWLAHYDDEYIEPFLANPSASRWRLNRVVLEPRGRYVLPPAPAFDYEEDSVYAHMVIASPDGWAVTVHVCYAGRYRFVAYVDTGSHRLTFDVSIAEVLDLPADEAGRIDRWVKRVRGPDWSVEHGEAIKEKERAVIAERNAAKAALRQSLREYCRDSRAREATRAGTILTASALTVGSLSARAARFARKGS